MSTAYSAGTDVVVRYFCAISVGLLFEFITSRFMNHLGMLGSTMFPTLALIMIITIPVWHLSAKLVSKRISKSIAEIATAAILAAFSVQPIYLHLYYSNVVLPTVTEGTKNEMLTWYVATVSNVTMAMLAALLYIFFLHVRLQLKKN